MKLKGIPYGVEMIRAYLADSKTMTRRPVRSGQKECPYGPVGTILWGKEAWADISPFSPQTNGIIYKADRTKIQLATDRINGTRWKSGRYLEKVASRIRQTVVEIRTERLLNISQEDAEAEGTMIVANSEQSPRAAFLMYWDRMYAKTEFKSSNNPMVWVVRFPKYSEEPAYKERL